VGIAAGEESVSDMRARMANIQAELDASAARIEELRDENEHLHERIGGIETRMAALDKQQGRLRTQAIERAQELYISGNSGAFEALLGSDDFAELLDRTEMLSQVSLDDSNIFVKLSRSTAELERLEGDLVAERSRLGDAEDALATENERLQAQFDSVAADYERLRARMAASAPAPAAAPAASTAAPVIRGSNGLVCPVGGPTSFVDSWGAPRSGHTHVGVDMMGSYGTPLVAITDGTITYAAYDGSGGNMIFMTGDDGHAYWYMHNQTNLVTGGRVSAGQQIATLGDTGNAAGTPHLHFEYHPNGGAPVNPYPLVASIC
jgi:peptidoglycan LD-endopeptidase LytH